MTLAEKRGVGGREARAHASCASGMSPRGTAGGKERERERQSVDTIATDSENISRARAKESRLTSCRFRRSFPDLFFLFRVCGVLNSKRLVYVCYFTKNIGLV